MKKSQRLKTIVDLNARNEKQALIALAEVQQKQQQLSEQLTHLLDYREEYKEKYQHISELGVNISQLLEFRSFISKLDAAIDEQQKALAEMENEVVFARKNWELKHHKTISLQKVCDSALAEEERMENKREQNEQDDRATRAGRNGGTTSA